MKVFCRLFLIASIASAFGAEECDPQATAQAMMENEAKFVAMGQEQSARAASLAYLADDAIMFEPGPVNAKKTWTARPEGGLSLKWHPTFAAMARSCDLGFTTGPAEWRRAKEDEKPLGYGHYLSIWKKQKDGQWKVIVDVGGAVPSAQKVEDEVQISVTDAKAPLTTKETAEKKLRAAEKWFAETAKTDSTSALIGSSSEDVRVHREGVFPAIGRKSATLMLSVRRGKLKNEKLGGDMSAACDLAYHYGKYTLDLSQKTEKGYYLQIWHTDAAGAWKILVDYQSPLGPEIKTISE
ncbi:MAG: nuclear transport factor 2 family protein [Chthoniobacterales bacterium]